MSESNNKVLICFAGFLDDANYRNWGIVVGGVSSSSLSPDGISQVLFDNIKILIFCWKSFIEFIIAEYTLYCDI